jgi:chromosome segregation ATPase
LLRFQRQLEVSASQSVDRANSLVNEKGRTEDKWIQAQQHIAELEEELTQCRAHIDLFKIRIEEEKDEKERVKVRLGL